MAHIERVKRGDLEARAIGLMWPACYIGRGRVRGIGATLFYGTTRPRRQTIVVTPTRAYGLSLPREAPAASNEDARSPVAAFDTVFAACRDLGPTLDLEERVVRAPHTRWPIWRDRVAQGALLGSVIVCAALFAVLSFRYPNLPDRLPMHYDATGQVDRIAPRDEVMILPVIGLIVWTVNAALGAIYYRRERMLAYVAWSGSLVVQVLFLRALIHITR
jgi:hypothetical protein